MKSIIYFTIFNVIAYISSKSETRYPANACQIKLIDDDSSGSQDNILKTSSIAISDLVYDLQSDVKEVYLYNNLGSASYPGHKCQYNIKACKDNNYGDCATFTGSVSVNLKVRGLKAQHPTFSSYFSSMNSIKGDLWVVAPPKPKPEPVPVIEKPVVPVPAVPGKPKTPVPATAPEWNLENQMERSINSKRKMRKSRKARKN